jgi:RHS repeat-associated protein
VFVVPSELAAVGDAPLTPEDAANTWGRGYAPQTDPRGSTVRNPHTPGTCPTNSCFGMLGYRIDLMMVSVRLEDTPLRYAPPVGPGVDLTIGYNQRESHQPATFTYTNLGPKWTLNWLSYVVDDPTIPSAPAGVFLPGGGQDPFGGYNGSTGAYAQDTRTRTTLMRVSSDPVRYERHQPDGSIEVFGQTDGAVGSARRVFRTQSIDPQGNALTFTYDGQTRLVAVTDAIGQVTTLAYDLPQDPWKLTRVTDPFGRNATFTYDSAGRLVTTTDVLGLRSSVTYGGSYVSSMTTPYGTTRFTTLDGYQEQALRVVEVTDPLGAKERVEYRVHFVPGDVAVPQPAVAGINAQTYLQYRNTLYWSKQAMAVAPGDPAAAHLYHWVHLKGNVSAIAPIVESEKPALERRIFYIYPNQQPGAGWEGDGTSPSVIARVLQDGTPQVLQVSYADYNDLGHPTKLTDPKGRETTLIYAANGIDLTQVRQTTNGLNDVLATYTYDTHHRPLTITDAANKTTTMTYNNRGQMLTSTNTLNQTTTLAYDGNGYLQSVTGPVSGATQRLAYDGYGRVSTTTDADAYAMTALYDVGDRPTSVTFPDGTAETFTYDRLDLVQTKDRAGRRSTTTYDALRRPVAMGDGLNRITRQTWCTCGSLSSVTDAKGKTTSWDRDVMARVTKETRANGSFTTYTYDPASGRLQSTTDPKQQVTTYGYGIDDALTSIAYTNAAIATPTVTMTYDPNYARLTSMTTTDYGPTSYTYAPVGTQGAGQPATVDGPLTNDTVSYTYDELGRQKTRALNGVTTTWNFDTLGRVQSEVDPIGTFTFAYDGVTARLQQLAYPNGQTSTYNYLGNAGDRRLQDIHHQTAGGTTLSRFSYAFDRVGNLTTWTQQYGTDVKAYDFSYDGADQLTGAVYRTADPTPSVLKRYGYTYDAVGNRTTARTDDAPLTFSYNNINQLTSQAGGGVVDFRGTTSEAATVTIAGKPATGAGGTTFSGSAVLPSGTSTVAVTATDANGNTATKSYEVDVPASTASSTYDANGNLIAQGTKTYEWDAADRLTRVLDDGIEIARFAYDGTGRRVQKVSGGMTRSYVHDGMDLLEERASSGTIRTVYGPGIDQPLASVDGGGAVSYYLADHLGSIVQQTNASAAVMVTRQYDPYGAPLQGAAMSGFAYTGREWDAEISLYYYRARYYDPSSARFISEDPINLAGGINMYAFVGGNPVRYVDPSGLAFGDYWDIRATTAYYDSVPASSYGWGPARAASFMLKTFGMQNAQNAGEAAGRGDYRCAAAQGILSLFKGLTSASPLLARSAMAGGPAMFNEARTFGTVSRRWWGMAEMNGNGASQAGMKWALDHWLMPNAAGGPNTWWNLAAIPAGLNSYMNGAPATMGARYMVNSGILGSLGFGAIAGGWAGVTECGCGK